MKNLNDHLLNSKQAEILSKEYERTNYSQINSSRPSGKPDSKHYIYDLEVLQEYINLIRDDMEKRGIRRKGIRISLGKYPDISFDPRLNPDFLGYQTIFFSAENMDGFSVTNRVESAPVPDGPVLDFGTISPPY